jgi:hypothetical protein
LFESESESKMFCLGIVDSIERGLHIGDVGVGIGYSLGKAQTWASVDIRVGGSVVGPEVGPTVG